MKGKPIYSTRAAAKYLGISYATIKYHIYERGTLKGDLLTSRTMVFTQDELDAFKATLPAPGRHMERDDRRWHEERQRIEQIIGGDDAAWARRAESIYLTYAEGLTQVEITERLGVSRFSVNTWHKWFTEGGIEALRPKRSKAD